MESFKIFTIIADPVTHDIVTEILSFKGHQIVSAQAVIEALDMMQELKQLDMAILDLGFRQDECHALLLSLKGIHPKTKTLLIAPFDEHVDKELASLSDGLLEKPLFAKAVVNTITSLLDLVQDKRR